MGGRNPLVFRPPASIIWEELEPSGENWSGLQAKERRRDKVTLEQALAFAIIAGFVFGILYGRTPAGRAWLARRFGEPTPARSGLAAHRARRQAPRKTGSVRRSSTASTQRPAARRAARK